MDTMGFFAGLILPCDGVGVQMGPATQQGLEQVPYTKRPIG